MTAEVIHLDATAAVFGQGGALAIGSLFSGVGGLDLSVETHFASLGFDARTVWQVEHDAFCNTILARHFPRAARLVRDVRAARAANLAPIDAICAGFPCQPVSLAGKRKAREDARWLWPECARIISEFRPRYVFLENVPGLLTADYGRAFGDVLGSLAALGYDAEWDCCRASDVGAPHRRERWFLLAYCGGVESRERCHAEVQRGRSSETEQARVGGGCGVDGLADASRIAERESADETNAVADRRHARPLARGDGESPAVDTIGTAQSRVGGVPHGLPGGLDNPRWPAGRGEPQHEWEPPRTAKGVSQRPARLKALGNAVVWQQASAAFLHLYREVHHER